MPDKKTILIGALKGANGQDTISAYKGEDFYLLKIHGYLDFKISSNGRYITYYPKSTTLREHIWIGLFGPALSLALRLQEIITLHSSAIAYQDQAIVFLGDSGVGKSTLSAAFAIEDKYDLITDDVLPIYQTGQEFYAAPGVPWIKLWPEVCNYFLENELEFTKVSPEIEKRYVPYSSDKVCICSRTCQLGRIYLLEPFAPTIPKKEIAIQPISPLEATFALVKHTFHGYALEGKILAKELRAYTRLASQVPVYRIFYPKNFEVLTSVRSVILEALREC